jgi:hypothetical protein
MALTAEVGMMAQVQENAMKQAVLGTTASMAEVGATAQAREITMTMIKKFTDSSANYGAGQYGSYDATSDGTYGYGTYISTIDGRGSGAGEPNTYGLCWSDASGGGAGSNYA